MIEEYLITSARKLFIEVLHFRYSYSQSMSLDVKIT